LALRAISEKAPSELSSRLWEKDALSVDMICGGTADVLVEYVCCDDTSFRSLFEKLYKHALARLPVSLLTSRRNRIGKLQTGAPRHALLDSRDHFPSEFPGAEVLKTRFPEQRLLKPAQLLEAPEFPHPVLVELLRPLGPRLFWAQVHVGILRRTFGCICKFQCRFAG